MEFLSETWMTVGVKKIVRHGGWPTWNWKPTELNPFLEQTNPFKHLRDLEMRGDILMAQRKVGPWHYELVVKARQK